MSETPASMPAEPPITDMQQAPPKKKRIPIHIRHAIQADVPQTTEIQRIAFKDFPMMRHIYRDYDVYTEEVKRFLNLSHRHIVSGSDHYMFVATDQESGKILGYSLWLFKNGAKAPQSWVEQKPTWWLDWLERKLLEYENKYYLRILDHKTIPGGADELFAGYDAAKGRYVKESQLYLRHLAVAPEYQGKGVGRALLHHGTDVARALGLPILLLCATDEAKTLYDQEGYKVVGEVVQHKGQADEVRSPFLVWDPNSLSI